MSKYLVSTCILALVFLVGCNEEELPKVAESEVDLSNPHEVKVFMGHFHDDKEGRQLFWYKVLGRDVTFAGEVKDRRLGDELIFQTGGVSCIIPKDFLHHGLRTDLGNEFECTGTYKDYNVYIGQRVSVSIAYAPTAAAIKKYNTPPKITRSTSLNARVLTLDMPNMYEGERELYWLDNVVGKEVFIESRVASNIPVAMLFFGGEINYDDTRIRCVVGREYQYLVESISEGEQFTCAGEVDETYRIYDSGGKIGFNIIYDPSLSKSE